MKVALVHEHLAQDGGAEKVLRVFQEMFPDAPTFVLVYNPRAANKELKRGNIRTSFLQHVPFGVAHYQWFLVLMPFAVERYPLNDYDLVLSSTSMFSKGVRVGPNTLHIDYCHTPTRFLWSDTDQYLEEMNRPWLIKMAIRVVLPLLRRWDYRAAQRPHTIIANSKEVQARIKQYYGRDSYVVHPPVDIERFEIASKSKLKDYFLTGGRLVPYKRFDLAILACNALKLPLVVFGSGPDEARLRKLSGPTIRFTGRVSDEERRTLFAQAQAFINAQVEDFGITPVESMASGRPVIAFAQGGALETVVDGKTGLLFSEQTVASLTAALQCFRPEDFSPENIRAYAAQFSRERFVEEMRREIDRTRKRWQTERSMVK